METEKDKSEPSVVEKMVMLTIGMILFPIPEIELKILIRRAKIYLLLAIFQAVVIYSVSFTIGAYWGFIPLTIFIILWIYIVHILRRIREIRKQIKRIDQNATAEQNAQD